MSEETVQLFINDKEVTAPKGAMLIEVTDQHDVDVPRFCYHKKLSVAANCRMCMVEVEKASIIRLIVLSVIKVANVNCKTWLWDMAIAYLAIQSVNGLCLIKN